LVSDVWRRFKVQTLVSDVWRRLKCSSASSIAMSNFWKSKYTER
jgi:hypothetical protein